MNRKVGEHLTKMPFDMDNDKIQTKKEAEQIFKEK